MFYVIREINLPIHIELPVPISSHIYIREVTRVEFGVTASQNQLSSLFTTRISANIYIYIIPMIVFIHYKSNQSHWRRCNVNIIDTNKYNNVKKFWSNFNSNYFKFQFNGILQLFKSNLLQDIRMHIKIFKSHVTIVWQHFFFYVLFVCNLLMSHSYNVTTGGMADI